MHANTHSQTIYTLGVEWINAVAHISSPHTSYVILPLLDTGESLSVLVTAVSVSVLLRDHVLSEARAERTVKSLVSWGQHSH